MSETIYQPRLRATRVRMLGEAVPVSVRDPDSVDDPPVTPKSSEELRAESEARRDAQPMTTSCGIDGCSWRFDGTAGECREQAAAHRGVAHPELAGLRTNRKRHNFKQRGEKVAPEVVAESRRLRQERDDQARLENIEQGRRKRGESLEEVAHVASGDVGAASSSDELDDLAETNPGPQAAIAAVEPLVAAPASTRPASTSAIAEARTSPGEISASTTTKEREPMEGKRTYARWSHDLMIERLQEVARDLGHTPTVNELRTLKLSALENKKMLERHGFTGGYHQVCREAGLEPPTAQARPATTLAVDDEPKPHTVELEVREAHVGQGSPLIRLLGRLTPELLSQAAGELEQMKHRLEAELALVDEAIDAQRAAA